MKKIFNILVFPGGTENGIEIYKSLRYCKEVILFSASSYIANHAEYIFKNHFYVSDVFSKKWISELNLIVEKNAIDFIFPANDSVINKLVEHRSELKTKLILPDNDVISIINSKSKTYSFFKDLFDVPKVYKNYDNINFPVFSKPDIGYGSQGINLINSSKEIYKINKNDIVMEYLPC